MNNIFIILSAGKGSRFKSKLPKQYTKYRGKMMVVHSVEKAIESKLFKKIILVIDKSHSKYLKKIKKNGKINIIYGGKERYKSSLISLNYIKKFKPKFVYIHDAARPNFSVKLLRRLNKSLKKNDSAVPYIEPSNSIKYKYKNNIKNLKREKIIVTQTPQCYKYNLIHSLSKKNHVKVNDESSLLLNKNYKVNFVKGENNNYKITNLNDHSFIKTLYGIGFDVHRLVKGRKFYLGGIKIKSKLGTLGHSDGDPVLHAVTDSILGACGMKDIGRIFSNNNLKYKNIRSTKLLEVVIKKINDNNFFLNNIDINIITETPKISKYSNKIKKLISKICNINNENISIKGKTSEKLGIIGKEKAVACEVITSVIKYD